MKPIIWQFWQDPPAGTPGHIVLCRETLLKHCSSDFDIRVITMETADQWSPGICEVLGKIPCISHRSDFVRWRVLRDFGGIWIDADYIVYRTLLPLLEHLTGEIDYVGCGSPEYSYGHPETSILICKKGGWVAHEMCEANDRLIAGANGNFAFPWAALSATPLWDIVKRCMYKHLASFYFFPISGHRLRDLMSPGSVDDYLFSDTFGLHLFNEIWRQVFPAIHAMPRDQMLSSPMLVGALFRRALSVKEEGKR